MLVSLDFPYQVFQARFEIEGTPFWACFKGVDKMGSDHDSSKASAEGTNCKSPAACSPRPLHRGKSARPHPPADPRGSSAPCEPLPPWLNGMGQTNKQSTNSRPRFHYFESNRHHLFLMLIRLRFGRVSEHSMDNRRKRLVSRGQTPGGAAEYRHLQTCVETHKQLTEAGTLMQCQVALKHESGGSNMSAEAGCLS